MAEGAAPEPADPGAEALEEPVGGANAEALAATAVWASPLQWASLIVSGGIVAFAVLSGHWQWYDWLFVLLFAVYLANAIGFRRLSRRVP